MQNEAASYPIGTIDQMAMIPPEAMPRFLAELPSLLWEIRRVQTIVAQANAEAGVQALNASITTSATWIDDEAQRFTQTFKIPASGDFPGFEASREGKISELGKGQG